MEAVNLAGAFQRFSDAWRPRIAAELNGQHLKLVKMRGEFTWHHHEHEDELFYVVQGVLRMQLAEGDILVRPGEFLVIPRGVEHCPAADEECHVMLLEPITTLNTGNQQNERTVENLEWI